MISDDSETRNLGLVFFDILLLNSTNLVSKPYSERRAILGSLIRVTAGRAVLADRFPIDMTQMTSSAKCIPMASSLSEASRTSRGKRTGLIGPTAPELALAQIFADHIADHQEGLVLKAEESIHNDWDLPWVKLKKDYIPGCGDCVDMVCVGAAWERDRARELRGVWYLFHLTQGDKC